MGQPTNAVFERVGSKQLWFNNWVATPAKYYHMTSTYRDWLLHRLVVLYFLYGLVVPRTHMWSYDVSKTRPRLWGAPHPDKRSRDQRALPNIKRAAIFSRYHRTFYTEFVTGDVNIKASATTHNRKNLFFNLFYSRVTIMQAQGWTVVK